MEFLLYITVWFNGNDVPIGVFAAMRSTID